MLKIRRKDGGRFPKRLSLQCESSLIGSVGERFRTQQQPSRWKRITFCGQYFRFSFTCMIRDSGVLPSELHRGKNVDADCWFLGRNVDAAVAWKRNCRLLLQKKNNFLSRSIKRQARQEVQPPCFLLTWYEPDPGLLASENSDQMIRFNLFRFLSGKKVQFQLSRKSYLCYFSS